MIALVREHAVGMRPPRALWVSFPLGRPLGAPDDPDLQGRVLAAALDLLVSAPGHGTLADFPEDVPPARPEDMEGLVCPVPLARPVALAGARLAEAVRGEIALLAPSWHATRDRRGRTTVGVSGLAVDDAVSFLAALATPGAPVPRPAPGLSLGQTLRFAAEDLRTWYLEAVAAREAGTPAARLDWFWGETAAGRLLLSIATVCREHPDAGVRQVVQGTMVPRVQAHRLTTSGGA